MSSNDMHKTKKVRATSSKLSKGCSLPAQVSSDGGLASRMSGGVDGGVELLLRAGPGSIELSCSPSNCDQLVVGLCSCQVSSSIHASSSASPVNEKVSVLVAEDHIKEKIRVLHNLYSRK